MYLRYIKYKDYFEKKLFDDAVAQSQIEHIMAEDGLIEDMITDHIKDYQDEFHAQRESYKNYLL